MPIAEGQKTIVMGLGYIGLPTAALIARSGIETIGVDVNEHVVETVNKGQVHLEEVDLDGLVRGVVERGTLRASLEVERGDNFLIAVPTPLGADNDPDISYVLDAAARIAPFLEPGNLIILESTSPVGTTEQLCAAIAEARSDLKVPGHCDGAADIFIAYCPERVLPGRILAELVANDRCIGGITPRCARRAMTFYRNFVRGECVTTTARAAELVKLVENSFRDVNIAFANELSIIADGMDIDVWDVVRLANRHPRVNILQPGPGVGGHCIAVDPWFIVAGDPANSRLIRTAREVNLAKTDHVVTRARAMISALPDDMKVALFGLAFKPNIDDFRESPALDVAVALAAEFGDRIAIVEPFAEALPKPLAGTKAHLVALDDALDQCGAIILLVDHDVFKSIPLGERRDKIVYDTRGLWPDQPVRSNWTERRAPS
ncbi:UDP-N-acetyl-D-mannosamine dehydrogenase [Sphingorhabdus soli]|uniref:UDP-N-acetyl-D-mannosamine dehydrogenase n=1 Tax=Flavisphingopyxis soli TaxID=2601267 RepID=A0A5C6UTF9_9SPHN|nr:UDP-N-acetyl-D-mannosamine dehydrogenase [Sphingorhabdus soli]TXC74228.1 UDP-N-acetyl-D-mannosamine dehydrogenase [Sphingorhabdus soli]